MEKGRTRGPPLPQKDRQRPTFGRQGLVVLLLVFLLRGVGHVVVEADPFVDIGTFLLVGKIRLTEAEAVVGGEGIPVELKEGGEGGGETVQ